MTLLSRLRQVINNDIFHKDYLLVINSSKDIKCRRKISVSDLKKGALPPGLPTVFGASPTV